MKPMCQNKFDTKSQPSILVLFGQLFLGAEVILTTKLEVRVLKLKIKLFGKYYFFYFKKCGKVVSLIHGEPHKKVVYCSTHSKMDIYSYFKILNVVLPIYFTKSISFVPLFLYQRFLSRYFNNSNIWSPLYIIFNCDDVVLCIMLMWMPHHNCLLERNQ
jgi:hypothetical protein